MELTINDKVYQFKFGMGFMREIDGRVKRTNPEAPEVKVNIGLQMAIAGLVDKDPVTLVDVLDIANKGHTPRVKRSELDDYIDDDDTDIDGIFDEVMDELKKRNATKANTAAVLEELDKLMAKRDAEE